MANRIFLFCSFGLLLLLSACSPRLTPFTESLYERGDFSEAELKRIQFYVSEDIVLSRELRKGESPQIEEGKIKLVRGKRIERVVVNQGTPGVLVFKPKDDRFAISFEEDDDAYLMFGPNPKYNDRYALLAKEWKRGFGKVSYKGNLYTVESSSAFATLMVDLRKIGDTDYKSRTARGRTVGK